LALFSTRSTWKEKLQATSSSTELVYGELLQLKDCTGINDYVSQLHLHIKLQHRHHSPSCS
jgi:hypothetical protein